MIQDVKNDILSNWRNGEAYVKLIILNVAVFIILLLVGLVYQTITKESFDSMATYYLGLPSDPQVLLFHPWSLLTHMFVHSDLLHIFSNMLLLSFAGRRLFFLTSNAIFYRIYFLSGIAGGVGYVVLGNLFLQLGLTDAHGFGIGSSACVMGCLVCMTILNPHEIIHLFLLGPIKIMYITTFLVLLDLLYLYAGNTGGHLAHLAGTGLGWWYGLQMKKGSYPGSWVNSIFSFFTFTSKPKMKVSHRRPMTDEEYNERKISSQKEIDAILDKISRSGYDSLSTKEKDILHKASHK
ncbi:MAG: rhomboid family intramembrane serine protease [Bacteroidia bacterium]|nr:rhomboid family intramembrane serine protease [Bacteroidia bacterium]